VLWQAVHVRSFSGLRTAQIRLSQSPAMSTAYTGTVTSSCCATRPGRPLTVRSRIVRLDILPGEIDDQARELLGAFVEAGHGADDLVVTVHVPVFNEDPATLREALTGRTRRARRAGGSDETVRVPNTWPDSVSCRVA
jgi:hypothetical protein